MAGLERVVMTSVWGLPHIGGISTHVFTIVSELRRRGVEVEIVSPAQARGYLPDRLPVLDPLDAFRNQMRALRYLLANRLRDLNRTPSSASNLTIIHCHDAMAALAAEAALRDVRDSCPFVKLTIVLTVHGYLAAEWVAVQPEQAGSLVHQYLVSLEKRAYQLAEAIIAVDKRLQDHVQKIGERVPYMMENFLDTNQFADLYQLHLSRLSGWRQNLPTSRIELDHGADSTNPISPDFEKSDEAADRIPTGRPVILCARRLTAKNGVRIAVHAMKLLKDRLRRRPDGLLPLPVLVIAGDGEQRQLIENDGHAMGLEHDVVMLGAVDTEKMQTLLRWADLAVVPSVHMEGVEEATSLAALEAMAAGVPVIASNIGGLRQLVSHGKTGWLVPDGNADALAKAIETILKDRNLQYALVVNARHSVETNHSVTKAVDRLLTIYDNAAKAKNDGLTDGAHASDHKKVVQLGPMRHSCRASSAPRRLRIVMLAAHNRLTGGARIFFEHANRLFKTGHDVWILAPCAPPSWFGIQVPWIQIDGLDLVETPQVPADALERFRGLAGSADVAVAMFWTQYKTLLATPVATKVLLEQGDPTFFEPAFQPDWVLHPMLEAYRAVPHVVTVSSVLTNRLREWGSRHVMTIPNAVDRSVFVPLETPRYPSAPYRILIVGDDLAAFKGIGDILAAVDLLRKHGMSVTVTQISPSGYRFFPGDRTILAHPGQDQIAKAYQESDVYVCGSWYEAFSLPCLEAMASGTAVVTTDNEGVREYAKDGVNCLMVPPRDPRAMAEAIRRVLADRDLWMQLRNGGLKTADEFSWERATARFEEAIRAAWNVDHGVDHTNAHNSKGSATLPDLPPHSVQASVEIASRCLIARFGRECMVLSGSSFEHEVEKWGRFIAGDSQDKYEVGNRPSPTPGSAVQLLDQASEQSLGPERNRPVRDQVLNQVHEWAGVLVRGGQARLAAALMQVALRFYPDDPDTWANLGLAFLESRQPSASLAALKEAARLLEDSERQRGGGVGQSYEEKKILMIFYQALALLQLGRSTEAHELFEHVAGGTGDIARSAQEILKKCDRASDAVTRY